MAQYILYNGAMPTTAAAVAVATGTAIKTLLQVKSGATTVLKVKEWGISFDGSAAATPGKVELIETDVAATVTAFVANDITKYDGLAIAAGDPTTAMIAVGTTSSGYTASGEGTPTATRHLYAPQFIAPTTQYSYAWPLGDEPVVQSGKFLRIRVTFGTTVNALAWLRIEV
jgi:hypothetical protein